MPHVTIGLISEPCKEISLSKYASTIYSNDLELYSSTMAQCFLIKPPEKDKEIIEMESLIKGANLEKKVAVSDAIKDLEKECSNLKNDLGNIELKGRLAEKSLIEKHQSELNIKNDIKIACIAEGPGGFMEAIINYRKK